MLDRAPSGRETGAVAAAVIAWGIGSLFVSGPEGDVGSVVLSISHVLVGWTFAATGLIAWRRRPSSRTGPLMVAVGFAWFLTALYVTTVPALFTAGLIVGSLGNWVIVHLALAFPSGRLEDRLNRILVLGVMYGLNLFLGLCAALTASAEEVGCEDCAEDANLLLAQPSVDVFEVIGFPVGVLMNLLVIAALIRRWRSAGPPERRVLAPFGLAALAAATIFLLATILPPLLGEAPEEPGPWGILAQHLGIFLLPLGFLAGLLRTRVTRSNLGTLMESLSRSPTAEELRDHLAEALGDPSLRVGYWAADLERYVESDGRAFEFEGPASYVEGKEGPLAVLVHDRFLLEDEGLVEATTAAARLALENARLQAEVHAQLAEVRASRARIVEAGDQERRRLERDLHDGAQQRLVSLALALKMVNANPEDQQSAALLRQAESEARAAVTELRELARGIHPQVLTDEGLEGALESLAERSPLHVELDVDIHDRLPPAAEAAAYFVCAEALTNAMKHASAAGVAIHAAQIDGSLSLAVQDDGAGGAKLTERGGLRGVADRVEALGGDLSVSSPRGSGTTVRARIPLNEDRS